MQPPGCNRRGTPAGGTRPSHRRSCDARPFGPGIGRTALAVVKVIELLGESEQSWEDAVRQVVAEATKTLHGVTSVYVKEFQATVENEQVKSFRVDAKVSFVLERR